MIDLEKIRQFISIPGLGTVILIGIILFLTVATQKILKGLIHKFLEKKIRLIRVDPTRYSFIKHFLSALIYLIGIGMAIYIVPSLRSLSVSLFAGAGVLAIILGFASQQAFSNIISGIFISVSKPYRVGDKIKVGTDVGVVEDITLRHTVIRNFENKRVIIPNATMNSEKIENFDLGDPKVCKFVEFGISYDSDVDKAIKIIQEESMKHPDFLDIRTKGDIEEKKPAVSVRVIGYGDFTVNLRAWVWAKDSGTAWKLGTDLNYTIKKRFDKEGIEIPFPYRTIVYKKDIVKKKNLKK